MTRLRGARLTDAERIGTAKDAKGVHGVCVSDIGRGPCRALSSAVWCLAFGVFTMLGSTAFAQPLRLAGSTCETPPVQHCPDANCAGEVVTSGGAVLEPKSGRTYFLDYPCDLKRGEKVTFVLSLHGGGSYGNWQRHYFPIFDYKDRYRLVIATPFSPRRVWQAQDDEYLQNIVSAVVDEIGPDNIKAFWLAGHSQGGATSRRLVCTDFFKDKVDGFLSLSGGRVGGAAPRAANAGPPSAGNATPARPPGAAAPGGAAPGGAAALAAAAAIPACDFSHIYTTGEYEIASLPAKSDWAQKYSCDSQPKRSMVLDTKAGYVYDRGRQNPGTKQWGLLPRPGQANVLVYEDCKNGKVVADVVRLGKGHTEGLEPKVTEQLVKLMLAARGGKLQAR